MSRYLTRKVVCEVVIALSHKEVTLHWACCAGPAPTRFHSSTRPRLPLERSLTFLLLLFAGATLSLRLLQKSEPHTTSSSLPTASHHNKMHQTTNDSMTSNMVDPGLLNKIDKLFACGVGDHIPLPQLVVVGDQSRSARTEVNTISCSNADLLYHTAASRPFSRASPSCPSLETPACAPDSQPRSLSAVHRLSALPSPSFLTRVLLKPMLMSYAPSRVSPTLLSSQSRSQRL